MLRAPALAFAFVLSVPPAEARDRFASPSKPWHLETQSVCTEHIQVGQAGFNHMFWTQKDVLPRNREKELGIQRVTHYVTGGLQGFSGATYFKIPATSLQAIMSNGDGTFAGDEVALTPLLKKKVETRARVRAQGLIDTKKNLLKLSLLGGAPLLGAAGLPAAASLFTFSSKGYKFVSVFAEADRIERTQRELITKDYTKLDGFDPRRLAEFFYGPAILQRTYSVVSDSESSSNNWMMVQVSIDTKDIAGRAVLLPFQTCMHPIAPPKN